MLEEIQIDELISILLRAKTTVFDLSISSSPVSTLLEVLIDLSLKLSNMFQDRGSRWKDRENPSIKFLDVADELGNPKSIKLRGQAKIAANPQLSFYFRKQAINLMRIKTLEDLPKDLYSNGKKPKNPNPKIKLESYHFFRRTRTKR